MSTNNNVLFSRDSLKKLSIIFMFIGGAALFASLFIGEPKRAASAYLTAFIYFLFLSLGSLFFLSVQYVSKSVWSAGIRKLMEALSSYLPFSAILLGPLLYYGGFLYEWFHLDHVKHDPILMAKVKYLNVPFFLVRLALFFSGWLFFYYRFVKLSSEGREGWFQRAGRYSVAFLVFFVLSFSLFSVDLLMSLDPHWFSTIFGVYTFAGAFQSALALMILLAIVLIPFSEGKINKKHLHDLGKFLMGMTLFWAYIAFSQYMLIWYANLPEETTFFVPRSKEPWMWVSISLLVFKFAVPFICLLPKWVKVNYKTVGALSILILIMQYVDVYWLVYPSFSAEKLYFGLLDICFILGFLGLFLYSVLRFLSKHSVLSPK